MVLAASGWIEKVFVHTYHSGNGSSAIQIHAVGVGGDLHRAAIADGGDFAIGDYDGLVGLGGRAGSIDHPHMLKGNDRGLHADELIDASLLLRKGNGGNQKNR